MDKHTERLELIALDKLIPYANNARTHSDDQIKKIQVSLREFGFVNPVLIDILDNERLTICQSNARTGDLRSMYPRAEINPIGDWSGGTDVNTGATNRKLGSDMADSVAGGGLHGKDLSKADVSINVYAFLKAQETGNQVELCCAIGDDAVDGRPYSEIVEIAKKHIDSVGGFEKFAEWGLF